MRHFAKHKTSLFFENKKPDHRITPKLRRRMHGLSKAAFDIPKLSSTLSRMSRIKICSSCRHPAPLVRHRHEYSITLDRCRHPTPQSPLHVSVILWHVIHNLEHEVNIFGTDFNLCQCLSFGMFGRNLEIVTSENAYSLTVILIVTYRFFICGRYIRYS